MPGASPATQRRKATTAEPIVARSREAGWARLAAALLAVLGCALVACSSTRRAEPLHLHPHYRPYVSAVDAALGRDDLALADQTLAQLRSKLAVDRARRERIAEAHALPPDLPTATDVAAGERALDGLRRIIDGRRLVSQLSPRLELRRVEGEQAVDVVLATGNDSGRELRLRPGPAGLEVSRVSLHPTTGHERQSVEWIPIAERIELTVAAEGESSRPIATIPIGVPSGMVATRTVVRLALRAGEILDGDERYPAQQVLVAQAERTDLPEWVPAAPVEPEELARLAADSNANPAALAERAVRILPHRRAEALERLRELDLAKEDYPRLVPSLRWLSGAATESREPADWKAYVDAAAWRARE